LKNKALIIVIVLILIAAGFFGYSKFANNSNTNPSVTITKDQNSTENSFTSTIKELLGKGLTQKCTITYPQDKGTGIMYFSGNKFSGEYTIETDGEKLTGHTLSDGIFVYVWSDASPKMGIKMKLDDVMKTSPTEIEQTGDLSEEVDFKCSSWTLDQAKFTPPAEIEFKDMSNLLPKTEQGVTPVNEEKKAGEDICSQISDTTAKAACLEAIQNAGE
jgi:hypothetical protein